VRHGDSLLNLRQLPGGVSSVVGSGGLGVRDTGSRFCFSSSLCFLAFHKALFLFFFDTTLRPLVGWRVLHNSTLKIFAQRAPVRPKRVSIGLLRCWSVVVLDQSVAKVQKSPGTFGGTWSSEQEKREPAHTAPVRLSNKTNLAASQHEVACLKPVYVTVTKVQYPWRLGDHTGPQEGMRNATWRNTPKEFGPRPN
jgi:hypothetical protein